MSDETARCLMKANRWMVLFNHRGFVTSNSTVDLMFKGMTIMLGMRVEKFMASRVKLNRS